MITESYGVLELNNEELLIIEGGKELMYYVGYAAGVVVGSAIVAAHMVGSKIFS